MITKKELLIFTISCIALVTFALSGEKNVAQESITFDTKEDKLLVDNIKHANEDLAKAHQNRNSKLKKDLKRFRSKLASNDLSRSFERAKATQKEQSETAHNERESSEVASSENKKEEKKKKTDEKKKVAKEDTKINPVKPLNPASEKKIAKVSSELESKDLASTTFTTNVPTQVVPLTGVSTSGAVQTAANTVATTTDQNTKDDDNSEEDTKNELINEITSVETTKSIYTNLLEEGRFVEFEQLLQTDLTEKKRIQAFKDALHVLFSSTEENVQEYDAFIFNQFFNDKYAVIISKSLQDKDVTNEQVSYSVNYLNQIVIEWQSEKNTAVFQQVYQNNVSSILAENTDRKDFFIGLQSSIEAKSILLSENSIEVSSN